MPLFFITLLFLSAPMISFAQELNAGFVNGLWYSRHPFFAGETVRIYAALQNNSHFDIKGKATFFDKDKKIGDAAFAAIDGRLLEVWTDLRATEGDHAISVVITEAFKVEIGKDPEPITLAFASFAAERTTVQKDTDGDREGDLQDTDDDNDGLSDAEEKTYHTNPLVADSDNDGLSDKKEIADGTDPLRAFTKEEKNSQGDEQKIGLLSVASTTPAFARNTYRAFIPRARQIARRIADAAHDIDGRANTTAKIIRLKKDNLEPSRYQSLFSVSLALLVPLTEHWRITSAGFVFLFLWFLWRRLRK